MSVSLYPFQDTAVTQAEELMADGKAVILQSPTGAGKTEMAMSLINRTINEYGNRVFFIPHRKELVANAVKRADKYGLIPYNLYDDGWFPIYGSHANLYVQSIMKLYNRLNNGYPIGDPDLAIFDEGHHATSRTWASVILTLKSMGVGILALTGTPWRMTKTEGFDHLFDEIVQTPQTRELIDGGYLSEVRFHIWGQSGITRELNRITLTNGDYSSAELEATIGSALVTDPWRAWVELCKDKHKTLIFAANRRAAIKIALLIQQSGGKPGVFITPADRSVDGDSVFEELEREAKRAGIPMAGWGDTAREKVFADFESGLLDTLVNVTILTEGIDVPDISAVILGRPTKSLILQRQMVGRGIRKAPDKEYLLVIDPAGVITEPEIGNPLSNYNWSLYPRGSKGNGETPPLPLCGQGFYTEAEGRRRPEEDPRGCRMEIYPPERHCKFCGLANGSICVGCREWRSGFRGGVECTYPHDDGHSCADIAENYACSVSEHTEWEEMVLADPHSYVNEPMGQLCRRCAGEFLTKIEVRLEELAEAEEEQVTYHYDGLVRWWSRDWIESTFDVPKPMGTANRYLVLADEGRLRINDYVVNGTIDTGRNGIKFVDGLVEYRGIKTNRNNTVLLLKTSKLRKTLRTEVKEPQEGSAFSMAGYYRQRRY